MSRAHRCETCDSLPAWRLERVGDAVVTWVDDRHLPEVLRRLQRSWERTEVVVTAFVPVVPLGLRTAVDPSVPEGTVVVMSEVARSEIRRGETAAQAAVRLGRIAVIKGVS